MHLSMEEKFKQISLFFGEDWNLFPIDQPNRNTYFCVCWINESKVITFGFSQMISWFARLQKCCFRIVDTFSSICLLRTFYLFHSVRECGQPPNVFDTSNSIDDFHPWENKLSEKVELDTCIFWGFVKIY